MNRLHGTKRDFDHYIRVAEEAVKRSGGLRATMNRLIAEVLRTSRKRGMTLRGTADALDWIAGPARKGQPVSFCNLRAAARRIRAGKELVLL